MLLITFLFWGRVVFASPQRIVSLKPNITEIIFALGVGDRVVGVTKYCDYPEEVKKLPKVADYTRPFVEPIIALKPDLVIGSREESSRKAVVELQNMGINVAILPFNTLDETIDSIRVIAKLVDETKKGEEVAAVMRQRLDELKVKWDGKQKKRVLAVVGRRPLIVFGRNTYMDELLGIIGAENVVGKTSVRYPRWSYENVIASNPEVIIDMSMGSEILRDESWNSLTTVEAVRNKKVFHVDIGILRQSPRLVDGIEKLAGLIH